MLDGDITLGGVSRTAEKAKKNLVNLIKKYFDDEKLDYEQYRFLVGTGIRLEEAEKFEKMLEEQLHIKCEKSIESRIGTAIGCHTGPFPLGVALIKRYDA